MTIRKFIQNGQAYGDDAVEIHAKIDGVTVFEGAVPTVDQPLPVVPFNEAYTSTMVGKTLFEWEMPLAFAGEFTLEIDVITGGSLVLASTIADHVNTSNSAIFGSFYTDENGISDPLSAVAINGVPVVARIRDLDPANVLNGQWWYLLNTGDVLTAQITISAADIVATA